MKKSVKVLLKFRVHETDKPIAWLFATKYNLCFSILQSDIRAGFGGQLIMDLTGEEEDISAALAFARGENVETRILSRTVCWDDEVCVHCGACTAVCIGGALSLDPVTASLSFDNSKCVACEMCTHACPTGAMRVELL